MYSNKIIQRKLNWYKKIIPNKDLHNNLFSGHHLLNFIT